MESLRGRLERSHARHSRCRHHHGTSFSTIVASATYTSTRNSATPWSNLTSALARPGTCAHNQPANTAGRPPSIQFEVTTGLPLRLANLSTGKTKSASTSPILRGGQQPTTATREPTGARETRVPRSGCKSNLGSSVRKSTRSVLNCLSPLGRVAPRTPVLPGIHRLHELHHLVASPAATPRPRDQQHGHDKPDRGDPRHLPTPEHHCQHRPVWRAISDGTGAGPTPTNPATTREPSRTYFVRARAAAATSHHQQQRSPDRKQQTADGRPPQRRQPSRSNPSRQCPDAGHPYI